MEKFTIWRKKSILMMGAFISNVSGVLKNCLKKDIKLQNTIYRLESLLFP
jgi:hypothetical protein